MADKPTEARLRPVRSYVLREGRITAGQRQAFERLWPRYGLDLEPGVPLKPKRLFGNRHPLVLEIGFGDGEALAAHAARHPELNFLGVEVHRPGIGHLLLELEKRRLSNVRVVRHDAVALLAAYLPPGSLERVQLFFPDPWPKKKHHKRRIVQPSFLELLHRVLAPGGIFHAATDWEEYAQHMLSVLQRDPRFENVVGAGRFASRPETRPLTKFERRGQRLGHGVWDLIYRRL